MYLKGPIWRRTKVAIKRPKIRNEKTEVTALRILMGRMKYVLAGAFLERDSSPS